MTILEKIKKAKREDQISKEEKEYFIQLLQITVGTCNSIRTGIKECNTYEDIGRFLKIKSMSIANHLGVDYDHFSEYDDLKDEKENLQDRISELEEEIRRPPRNLLDQWKFEIFQKYAQNISPIELEKRLSN